METLQLCPVCSSNRFAAFLECKDNTVSRETFKISQCENCGFKFTNPRPDSNKLSEYYKSDNYISHSNSSKGIINFLYQKVRKHTLGKKLGLVTSYCQNGKILDVGCGTGEFLKTCKDVGWETIGIEPSPNARNYGIERYGLEVFDETKIEELKSECYDVITLWHVLEHVPELAKRVREIKRLLKPQGVVMVAVPNCTSFDAKYYKQYWAAYDLPRHLYHFAPYDIQAIFNSNEMYVEKILPMKFDAYYVSLLSEKYLSGRVRPLRALFAATRSNLSARSTGNTYSSQIYVIRNK